MKIVIIEVVQDGHQSVYTITLRDRSSCFMEDCVKYEVSDYIIEVLKDQEVLGWVDGVNRYNKPVKRTYMLVPE